MTPMISTLRGLGRFASPGLAHHFKDDLRAAMFVAALVVVAEKFHLLSLLTKMSLLLVANLATPAENQVALSGQGPVVAYMQEQHWTTRYGAQSPLDRCLLAQDLERMLARGPRSLAVDFDLSPNPGAAASPCQRQLDAVLDRHGQRLALLAPLRTLPELVGPKRDWMLARCANGVRFGDGSLDQSMGAVIDVSAQRPSLAKAMRASDGGICEQVRDMAGAERWLRRAQAEAEDDTAFPTRPINFRGFAAATVALPMDAPEFDQIENWAQRDMLFGGDYGSAAADSFLTPIGRLPGVAVHAAQLWTLEDPVHEVPHILAFWLDVGMAYLCSVAILAFWTRYVDTTKQGGWRAQWGAGWVLLFVLAYSALVLLLFDLAVRLFAKGVLIAPLLVATVMLFDGFVSGPINAFALAAHKNTRPAAGPLPGTAFSLLLLFASLAGLAKWAAAAHLAPSGALVLALAPLLLLCERFLVAALAAGQGRQTEHGGQGAHGDHGGHGGHLGLHPAAALLGAAAGVGVLALSPLAPLAWPTMVFGAVAGALVLPMLFGLLLGLARPRPAMPDQGAGWAMLGLPTPAGAAEHGALALYLLRQTIFWAVLAYAAFSMMHH